MSNSGPVSLGVYLRRVSSRILSFFLAAAADAVTFEIIHWKNVFLHVSLANWTDSIDRQPLSNAFSVKMMASMNTDSQVIIK